MEELMKMLFDMITDEQTVGEGGGSKDLEHKEDKVMNEQVKKDVDSYVSLMSDEEREAVKKVKTAVSDLIDIHNRNVMARGENLTKSTALQRIIYMMVGDFVKDIQSNVISILSADTKGVESVAEFVTDEDISFEQLEKTLTVHKLAEKLFG